MMGLDETHAAELTSWVATANNPSTDFPIQNLPFCVFRRKGSNEGFRGGVAIGDQVLDLTAALAAGGLVGVAAHAAHAASGSRLNEFMALGSKQWSILRLALSRALREGAEHRRILEGCLVAQNAVEYALPVHIGDYSDFYIGIHHARAVGKLFRPDNPLLPNYRWVPIGYHGRSSSVIVSGEPVFRPTGQSKGPNDTPNFGPTSRLDYELELAFLIGQGNERGAPVPIDQAEDHIFGVALLNDWSARDIQPWEYQPLGPFVAKNFATTIAPWVVTLAALAPFRCPLQRESEDDAPLPYLRSEQNRAMGAIDVRLEVLLQTAQMRREQVPAEPLGQSSFADAAYWTPGQLVAHHTVGGCNLRPGDVLGSGTLSGRSSLEAGSMIERTKGGQEPIHLRSGERRTFLEDGDTVTMRAWCERPDARRIGFGECVGTVEVSRPETGLS